MKKIIAGIALATASSLSFAGGWSGSLGYSQMDVSGEYDLGAIEGSVQYQFESNSIYTSGIAVDLAIGVSDDSIREDGINYTAELENYLALSYVGQVDFNDLVYGTFNIGYARSEGEVEAESMGVSASASGTENDFVYGIGIGFNATEKFAIELDYRDTGSDIDSSIIGLSARFHF